MNNQTILRLFLDLLIAVCIIQGWWFFAIPLGIAGVFYFPYFVEIVIAGVAYTALFGSVDGMGIRGYLGVIVSVIIFALVAGSKRAFRMRG